jgi:HSP20 family protein
MTQSGGPIVKLLSSAWADALARSTPAAHASARQRNEISLFHLENHASVPRTSGFSPRFELLKQALLKCVLAIPSVGSCDGGFIAQNAEDAVTQPKFSLESPIMFIVPVSRRTAVRARHFDRLLDTAFDQLFAAPAADSAPVRQPAIDVSESDRGYVVTLDVPGVTREDVKVSIDGRRVSVVAEARSTEAAVPATDADGTAADPSKATDRVILRERAFASFARSFTLQSEIDQGSSQAKLDNGVLTLTLTKRHPAATQLTVN